MRLQDYFRLYSKQVLAKSFEKVLTHEELIKQLIGRNKSVLDLGGASLSVLQSIRDGSNELHVIEPNVFELHKAEELGVTGRCNDINRGIPCSDKSFEIIHAVDIFERIFDPKFFLSECARVLERFGTLVLVFQNQKIFKSRNYEVKLPDLDLMLRGAGFTMRKINTLASGEQYAYSLRRMKSPIYRVAPSFADLLLIEAIRDSDPIKK